MVRKALGPDALILSQEAAGQGIVVTAGLEEDLFESAELTGPDDSQKMDKQKDEKQQDGKQATPLPGTGIEPADEILAPDTVQISSVEAELPNSAQKAKEVQREVNQVADTQRFQLIVPELPKLEYPLITTSLPNLRGRYRFVGASGVGKTALVIKLLSEWVLHNGAQGALVIASDDQRLAANESLLLTCQLLGVDIQQSADVEGQLRKNIDKDLVLVDTCAAELQAHRPIVGLRDVVVLSALHSPVALSSQIELLSIDFPALTAITHVDQTFATEALTEWLNPRLIKPAFLGSSAYVPGGIEIASEMDLSRVLALTTA